MASSWTVCPLNIVVPKDFKISSFPVTSLCLEMYTKWETLNFNYLIFIYVLFSIDDITSFCNEKIETTTDKIIYLLTTKSKTTTSLS